MTVSQTPFLRAALLLDAAATAATGLLLALGADALQSWLGLPAPLMRVSGLILLPFAAFVLWLGTRPAPSRAAVWAVIAINALWTVDSLLLLASGWVQPTGLGLAFVVAQAVAVGLFAELQCFALRRAQRTEAAA